MHFVLHTKASPEDGVLLEITRMQVFNRKFSPWSKYSILRRVYNTGYVIVV